MISSVKKLYNTDNQFSNYELVLTNGQKWSVPLNEKNRHYQAIQEWIAEGNTVIDNGGNN
jgi:hypothetical protein